MDEIEYIRIWSEITPINMCIVCNRRLSLEEMEFIIAQKKACAQVNWTAVLHEQSTEDYLLLVMVLLKHDMVKDGQRCVVWVRHAESLQNVYQAEGRYDLSKGMHDAPLSERGKKSLEYISSMVDKLELGGVFENVFCSPLTRTIKTCEAITKKPIKVLGCLAERATHSSDIGDPMSVLRKRYPQHTFEGDEVWWSPVIESVGHFRERLRNVWRVPIGQGHTLVVSHGGVIGQLFDRLVPNCGTVVRQILG